MWHVRAENGGKQCIRKTIHFNIFQLCKGPFNVCILPIKLICYTYLILSLLSPSKYTKFAGSLTTPLLQVWCGSPVSLFSTDFLIQKAARTIESEPTPAAFLGVRTISCFHTGKGYLHDKATCWTQICLNHKFWQICWSFKFHEFPDSQIGLETLPATRGKASRGKQNKMKSKASWNPDSKKNTAEQIGVKNKAESKTNNEI